MNIEELKHLRDEKTLRKLGHNIRSLEKLEQKGTISPDLAQKLQKYRARAQKLKGNL